MRRLCRDKGGNDAFFVAPLTRLSALSETSFGARSRSESRVDARRKWLSRSIKIKIPDL